MAGFNVVENGHVVTLLAPQYLGAAGTSDIFSMKDWSHASIIVLGGAGSATTLTLYECQGFGGTGATLIGFRYAQEETAAGDVVDAVLATATTAGVAIGTATGIFTVIELDAAELSDGYQYVRLNASDPGTSKLIGAVAILSGGRFQKDITATAIA